MGITAFIAMALWLPETLDPEKLNKASTEGHTVKFINPFSSLALLRSPTILVLVSRRGFDFVIVTFIDWSQTLAGTTALMADWGKSVLSTTLHSANTT